MVRDPLLEQIRERWHERIDRRLATVLALSIGAHLAIAVAAWMGDPPAERPWLVNHTAAVFTADQIPDLPPLAPPALVQAPAPGIAAVAPKAAPAPAPAPGRARSHAAPRPLDAAALISSITDDADGLADAARRHRIGEDLDTQLDAARSRDGAVRIGNGATADPEPGIHAGSDPVVDGTDAPTRTAKRPEAAPPRLEPVELGPGTTYDPTNEIRRLYMRALTRCYRQQLALDPSLQGRLDLTFSIGTDGHVASATTRGLEPVGPCVARLARGWSFPFTPDQPVTFRLAMIFLPT